MRFCDCVAFSSREEAEDVLGNLRSIAYMTTDQFVTLAYYMNLTRIYKRSVAFETKSATDIGWYLEELNCTRVSKERNKEIYKIMLMSPHNRKARPNCYYSNYLKEENNMPINYNYRKNSYSFEVALPEDVEFEKKRKELTDEAEKKILDIRHELAIALDALESERFEQKKQIEEKAQAKDWKRKYDALVEAGFTEDQAWMMTMKSFEID